MNRLTNEELMEYLDGALSDKEMARVEAHLQINAEDAALVEEIQFAQTELRAWHETEPMQVGENFWPNLRDKLGPTPQRSAWSRFKTGLSGVFGVSPVTRLSVGAAVAAIVLALGAFFFAPQSAVQPLQADDKITQSDMDFIQRSMARHDAYNAVAPVAGDVATAETGADEDESHDQIP